MELLNNENENLKNSQSSRIHRISLRLLTRLYFIAFHDICIVFIVNKTIFLFIYFFFFVALKQQVSVTLIKFDSIYALSKVCGVYTLHTC